MNINSEAVKINLPAGMRAESPPAIRSSVVADRGRKVWKSCCLVCDRAVVVFVASYLMLACLLCFFGAGLWSSTDCSDKNMWQSLLLLVLGVILPNPKLS